MVAWQWRNHQINLFGSEYFSLVVEIGRITGQ